MQGTVALLILGSFVSNVIMAEIVPDEGSAQETFFVNLDIA